MTTVVHKFYAKHLFLKRYFEEKREISLAQDIEDTFRKALALAAGSYFEVEITNALEGFVKAKSGNNEMLVNFVKNKALNRQYHTFFKWDSSNANTFFGLLGEDFKDRMTKKSATDPLLKDAIKNFIELGELRNKAAHQNFAAFVTDKTSEEIMKAFELASAFLDTIRKELSDHNLKD